MENEIKKHLGQNPGSIPALKSAASISQGPFGNSLVFIGGGGLVGVAAAHGVQVLAYSLHMADSLGNQTRSLSAEAVLSPPLCPSCASAITSACNAGGTSNLSPFKRTPSFKVSYLKIPLYTEPLISFDILSFSTSNISCCISFSSLMLFLNIFIVTAGGKLSSTILLTEYS